jgi:hypothetical protein
MAVEFEEVGKDLTKTITNKKYRPFIIGGLALGVIGFIYAKNKKPVERGINIVPDETSKVSGSVDSSAGGGGSSNVGSSSSQLAQLTGFFTKALSDSYRDLSGKVANLTVAQGVISQELSGAVDQLGNRLDAVGSEFDALGNKLNLYDNEIDALRADFLTNQNSISRSVDNTVNTSVGSGISSGYSSGYNLQVGSRTVTAYNVDNSNKIVTASRVASNPEPSAIVKSVGSKTGTTVNDAVTVNNKGNFVIKPSLFNDASNWRDGQYIGAV